MIYLFFFFNDTATTEIYTLSLHDALPISFTGTDERAAVDGDFAMLESELQPVLKELRQANILIVAIHQHMTGRSEEHTSELQSQSKLVCRLLLEKKKKQRVCAIRIDRHNS